MAHTTKRLENAKEKEARRTGQATHRRRASQENDVVREVKNAQKGRKYPAPRLENFPSANSYTMILYLGEVYVTASSTKAIYRKSPEKKTGQRQQLQLKC